MIYIKKKKNFILILSSLLIIITLFSGFYIWLKIKNENYKCPDCNVIYISIDALRADHLGCYGYHRDTSPNIDRLASEGILFSQAISQEISTAPSLVSIMTSLYPSVHGIENPFQIISVNRGENLPITLAEILNNHGYLTIGFGSGQAVRELGVGKGFKEFQKIDTTIDNGELKNQIFFWLENNYDKKFFLFFHTYSVHKPYILPAPYENLYDYNYVGKIKSSTEQDFATFEKNINYEDPKDLYHLESLYDSRIKYTDEFIGEIFKKLGELNLFKNSLIILTADHGEVSFEQNIPLYRRVGRTLHDELLHVPLILKIPNAGHQIINWQVQSIDIMPTILDILDINSYLANKQMQGKTLIPTIYGKNLNIVAFSSESPFGNKTIRKAIGANEWKYVERKAPFLLEISVGCRGKIPNIEKDQLYDLKNDPKEQYNLMNKAPKILKKLKKKLTEWEKTNEKLRQKYSFLTNELTDKDVLEKLKKQLKDLGYIE